MPIQAPQWTEFLACPVCTKDFNEDPRPPISLGCGHTICKLCLSKLSRQLCPYDQTEIHAPVDDIPINHGLLQLLIPNHERPEKVTVGMPEIEENQESFDFSRMCIEDLAKYLLPFSGLPNGFTGNGVNNGKMMEQLSKNAVVVALNNGTTNGGLTRPMQRKLVTLVNCQLIEEEGRCKAIRAARSLGERTVKELILLHQNPQHLSTNLWTAVRNRGCQFLGPAMQEEVLKLILLALEDGNSLSRKVLVLFVVQKLESKFTQASKTSIGHVVQLLYRASCFKVTKREGDSSLLQLHEKFRTYSALRKEHDAQVVQIAMEAGLHISPEQWSALLYGDDDHKSHMQSIIDKLQTPASFSSSIQELIIALQRTQDPADLQRLREDLERLADIDPSPEGPPPTWEELRGVMESLKFVVNGLVDFTQNYSSRLKGTMEAQQTQNNKYKTSMCRDILRRASCPRGSQCSFAHTGEELEKFRKKKGGVPLQVAPVGLNRSGSSSPPEATGTPNGLENGMNGSRESPDEIIRNGSNGTQSIPVLSVTDSMQNGAYYKRNFANVNYQRLPVQPEPQVNSIPVTYLPAAVQQMQPARTMYANGNEQPLGVYYSANQNSYIQAGMMLNANEQQCMPMGTQQYLAYYAPQYRFPHATGRGTHEKDKDSSDLDKGCVSRDIITENIRDDLKLDTGRSSCSLFSSSKNDFIWRDSCDKIRGSSIGSGLDTSSEYSPETFSPLSNESCGSPQSSQMQSYGSTWNQFDPYHQSSKEGRDLSQHPALSPLNGLAGSTIWSQGVDGDVFPDKSLLKTRSYPKTDWDQRMFIGDGSRSHQQVSQAYRDLLMTKKDDDDKPVGFNYSGDTQSSFEEASSEDLGTSRYSEWSYNELKRVGAPPGLQQAPVLQPAPIGTPAKSKAHHYNGKVHERGEFPRAQSRRSFPSISSLDGIALD